MLQAVLGTTVIPLCGPGEMENCTTALSKCSAQLSSALARLGSHLPGAGGLPQVPREVISLSSNVADVLQSAQRGRRRTALLPALPSGWQLQQQSAVCGEKAAVKAEIASAGLLKEKCI